MFCISVFSYGCITSWNTYKSCLDTKLHILSNLGIRNVMNLCSYLWLNSWISIWLWVARNFQPWSTWSSNNSDYNCTTKWSGNGSTSQVTTKIVNSSLGHFLFYCFWVVHHPLPAANLPCVLVDEKSILLE